MKSLKRGNFSEPTLIKKTTNQTHPLNELTKNYCHSISTRDSEEKILRSEIQGPKLKCEEMKIMNERIAAGDKKLKTIIHILFRFEEQSILEDMIDSKKLKIFRSKSRTYLGRVMSNYELFRF